MASQSVRALLAGVVDYAGLFPPAGLSMADAVSAYEAAATGPNAWMLGRFVVTAARLDELAAARHAAGRSTNAWRISAIIRDRSDLDVAAVSRFNAGAGEHRARVDAIESKPDAVDSIDWLAATFGTSADVYVEVAPTPDAARWLERIRDTGLRAKVRTGGLSAEAFPSPAALAAFFETAIRLGVTFKATAGLHHAVRGRYPLTYEPDAARAVMHGYLNVLVAVAALHDGLPVSAAERLLAQTDTSTLHAPDEGIRWAGALVPTSALMHARERCLVSFGSCSFTEPADDARALPASAAASAPPL
jgi:hypothetical protein